MPGPQSVIGPVQYSLRSLMLIVTAFCGLLAVTAVNSSLAASLAVCALGVWLMALGRGMQDAGNDQPRAHKETAAESFDRYREAVRTGRFFRAPIHDDHVIISRNAIAAQARSQWVVLAGSLVVFYSSGVPLLWSDGWPSLDGVIGLLVLQPAMVPNPFMCLIFWLPYGLLLSFVGGGTLLGIGVAMITKAQRNIDRSMRFLPPLAWAFVCWTGLSVVPLMVRLMLPDGIG